MEDLIQLGAYVLIILVIGGASVIKKILESQKRRQEMEKHQVKTLSPEPTYSRETEEQTTSGTEEAEREIILESELESESGEKPRIEDILKEVFNIPTVPQKQTPTIKGIPRKQEKRPQPVVKPQMVSAAIGEIVPAQPETETYTTEPNWEVFATGLKSRGLTEIQRTIVMSELIQKPSSRRVRR